MLHNKGFTSSVAKMFILHKMHHPTVHLLSAYCKSIHHRQKRLSLRILQRERITKINQEYLQENGGRSPRTERLQTEGLAMQQQRFE